MNQMMTDADGSAAIEAVAAQQSNNKQEMGSHSIYFLLPNSEQLPPGACELISIRKTTLLCRKHRQMNIKMEIFLRFCSPRESVHTLGKEITRP